MSHSDPPLYFQQAKIAGSPDGEVFAVVKFGAGASIALFDLQTGKKVRERQHDVNTVTGLCFSPEGDELHVYDWEHGRLRIKAWNRALEVVESADLSLANQGGDPKRFDCLQAKAG